MGPCADAAMCTVRSRTGGIVLGGGTPWTTIACGPDCALGRVGEIRGHDDGRRPVDEFAGMVGFDAAETALLLLRPAGTFDFASATTLTLCALARMADRDIPPRQFAVVEDRHPWGAGCDGHGRARRRRRRQSLGPSAARLEPGGNAARGRQ